MKAHHTLVISLLSQLILPVQSCLPDPHILGPQAIDPEKTAYENNQQRKQGDDATTKVAINNVRVFDGYKLLDPSTIVIDGKYIGEDPDGAEQIDGLGGVLIPGLIDSHNHVSTVESLNMLSGFGVTTTMIMACPSISLCYSVQGHVGLTDAYIAGLPAIAPNSTHAQFLNLPANETVSYPWQADGFVRKRVAQGANYIKLVAEDPDSVRLSQDTLNAFVYAAHAYEKLAVTHAASKSAVKMALEARSNQVHHSPLDQALDSTNVDKYIELGSLNVPTLITMKGFSLIRPNVSFYNAANDSVTALYKAGVPILAGTDALGLNVTGFPYIPFGDSLHTELELLVQAGLSTVDVLRAATILPAEHFGLSDRGLIEPGRRADLVLLSGDPIKDIRATRSIQRVWIEGIEYSGVNSSSKAITSG